MVGVVGALVLFAGADYLIGVHEEYLLSEKRRERERVDRLVSYGLRMGIEEITFDREGRYRVALRLQNAGDEALFVMLPTLRLFLQWGTGWEEIPVAELGGDEGTVVRLVSDRVVERQAKVPRRDFAYLLPGYFHAKISAGALVAFRAEPKDDVGERVEELFLFLRSWMATDREILKEHTFVGGRIPTYIPLRAPTLVPSRAGTG